MIWYRFVCCVYWIPSFGHLISGYVWWIEWFWYIVSIYSSVYYFTWEQNVECHGCILVFYWVHHLWGVKYNLVSKFQYFQVKKKNSVCSLYLAATIFLIDFFLYFFNWFSFLAPEFPHIYISYMPRRIYEIISFILTTKNSKNLLYFT